MGKFKLFLTGNTTKTINAKSSDDAKDKFYGSAYHFATEKGIKKITKK